MRRANKSFLRLIIIVGLLLFGQQIVFVSEISKAAERLIKNIDKQFTLQDAHVQIQSGNFHERDTGQVHPFAAQFYDAVLTALSKNGAIVSIHEHGDQPLALNGTYTENGKYLTLQVTLRQMQDDGSVTVAAAMADIKKNKLDQQQLESSLTTLAGQLIAEIEKVYTYGESPALHVAQPKPGSPGQPTLRLGSALRDTMKNELQHSDIFGGRLVVGDQAEMTMNIYYTVVDELQVKAVLTNASGKELALSSASLEKQYIASTLFEPIDDRNRQICVAYHPDSSIAEPIQSSAVSTLMAEMVARLNQYNLKPDMCDNEAAGIQITLSMSIKSKKTPDGYKLLNGSLGVDIVEGGKNLGRADSSAKKLAAGSLKRAREALVDKLLNESFIKEISTLILSVE